MASTEEYLGCPEDLGDLPHPLEEVDQPPSMGTGNEVVKDSSTHEGRQVIDEEDETNCPGKHYPKSDADEIERKWVRRYIKQLGEYSDIYNEIMAREDDDDTPFPPHPLKVFPHATAKCILGDSNCYHRVYKTHDTSATSSALGYCTPKEMLQFFSVCLSSSLASYPISVYGIFAVRDELDPRRNCIFNCSRDDAVTIEKQDSFVLPLCSPCRGMYVRDRALLEADLWIKEGGKGSVDKQLLSAYAEIDIRAEYNYMLHVRIPSDDCNLDIKCMALTRSVETVIQVYAKVDHPCHVRFTAFSTCYDDYEILIFDGKLFGNEKLFQHVVTVKASEKLDVLLKVGQSLFQWTFQDEHVGAVCAPDDSIFAYGQFFVRVLFAPKDYQRNPSTTFRHPSIGSS
ncbi:uncharacterized protein [Lolium perenne]|uniref:uncharacterized protein isoform X2 n=1 Tax=Lolium perenne TaxID=4522 RepID=UPI0021F64ED2|nr:uncharacterized protein LOC127307874 isoform X2 [Lolium perenne]